MSETQPAVLQKWCRSPPAARLDDGREVIATSPLATLDRNIARTLATAVAGEHRLAFARAFTFAAARGMRPGWTLTARLLQRPKISG